MSWSTAGADIALSVREMLEELIALPRVVQAVKAASGHPESQGSPEMPGNPDPLRRDLIAALVELGWRKEEARKRFEAACLALAEAGKELRAEDILKEALRPRRPAPEGNPGSGKHVA